MLHGLGLLARDPDTKVIVLISKPPSPAIAREVLAAARKTGKPVVVNFIGSTEDPSGGNLHVSRTLDDAAAAAVALAKGRKPTPCGSRGNQASKASGSRRGQRYIRGLFSGGTFCYEASAILGRGHSGEPYGRTRRSTRRGRIEDPWKSREHTLIDLGDDVFTRGRPHPMIDLRLRNERMLEEAADPQVAVILLDVVLGYGSHPDPASEIVPVLMKIRKKTPLTGHRRFGVRHRRGPAGPRAPGSSTARRGCASDRKQCQRRAPRRRHRGEAGM